MSCGMDETTLWSEVLVADGLLDELPLGDERDAAGARWRDAMAEWKRHLDDPIAVRLGREGDRYRIELVGRGVTISREAGQLRTDAELARLAAQMWDRERPRRTKCLEAEEACDAAKREGVLRLTQELKRQRGER